MINNLEVKYMYRLFFRKEGTETWNEGATFSDKTLTEDAREMLIERNARDGLETKFEKVPKNEAT
jgi:hypothetical protein